MANDDGSAARAFHAATKHSLESLHAEPHFLDWDNLPTPFKHFRGLLVEPLPAAEQPSGRSVLEAIRAVGPPRRAGERPARLAIARLLHYSLGILRRRALADGRWHEFRAAPCTGALYHVDAYLVTSELPDLAAGVYHYAPREAALGRLRTGDWRGVLAEASGGEPNIAQAAAIAVLASTYWRNAWKYRRRAYRHVFWDGGTIIAQLLAQAAADGWPASVVLGFADRAVEHLCALDPQREGVVALVALGSGAPVPAPRDPPPLRIEIEPSSSREISYPEIVEVHARGALEDGAQAAAWRSGRPPARVHESRGPAPDLAAADERPAGDLDAVIRRRGSTRSFERRGISRSALEHLLGAASAPVPADYRRSPDESLVELYLIVNAVEGVEPGAHRWHVAERRLECLWRGERRREAGYLALGQALGADAAVDVYAIADLDRILAKMGTRGYRAATLDGAIAGGRIYLAAYADRLGATGLTFFDDDVARFFQLDPKRFGVMFLTAVGVPARGGDVRTDRRTST
jgi:SagB-type dehydrogenase family enzyme